MLYIEICLNSALYLNMFSQIQILVRTFSLSCVLTSFSSPPDKPCISTRLTNQPHIHHISSILYILTCLMFSNSEHVCEFVNLSLSLDSSNIFVVFYDVIQQVAEPDVIYCNVYFQVTAPETPIAVHKEKIEPVDEDDSQYEQLFASVLTATDNNRSISEMFKVLPSRAVSQP